MTEDQPDPVSSSPDEIAEQAIAWCVRLHADSVSAADKRSFQAWSQADPSHRLAYAETLAFWEDAGLKQSLAAAELSPDLLPLQSRRRSRPRYFTKPLAALAAGVALAISAYQPTLACFWADYCTAIGEIKTVQLADGSQVSLNSASAINVDFRQGMRHVRLARGEAYFDVQRDPQRPFLVASGFSNTRVLGTQFVVNASDHSDTVSVLKGVVDVSGNGPSPATLHANESISINGREGGGIKSQLAVGVTAWLKGNATFDNAPLSEVILELGRYRRGTMLIKNEALRTLKVSGRFDIRDTDKALESLQQTLPIRIYRLTPWLLVIA